MGYVVRLKRLWMFCAKGADRTEDQVTTVSQRRSPATPKLPDSTVLYSSPCVRCSKRPSYAKHRSDSCWDGEAFVIRV